MPPWLSMLLSPTSMFLLSSSPLIPPTLTPLLLVYNVTFAPPPLPDLRVAGTPDIVKALSVQVSGGGKRKQSERVPVAVRAP